MAQTKAPKEPEAPVSASDLFTTQVLDRPERFLLVDADLANEILAMTTSLFAEAKALDFTEIDPLSELYTKDFPDNQIWEQLQLRNQPIMNRYTQNLLRLQNWVEELEDEANDVVSVASADEEEADSGSEAIAGSNQSEGSDDDDDSVSGSSEKASVHLETEAALDISEEESEEEEEEEAANEETDGSESDGSDKTLASTRPAPAGSRKPRARKYEFEDDFFSLGRMDKHVDHAERKEMDDEFKRNKLEKSLAESLDIDSDDSEEDEDEEIDLFQDPDAYLDEDSDEEGADPDEVDPTAARYADFFSTAGDSSSDEEAFEDEANSEDEDDGGDEEPSTNAKMSLFDAVESDTEENPGKSRFELQQEKARQRIEVLERENVSAKNWTMIGEASAKDRPVNSLLEQDLEFIQGKKAVPVITAELTETLEEFIKRRIVDREFDDVERRKESNATVFKPSEAVELDHEQNSKSLAEVYEQEYQNKAQLMQGIAPTNEKKAALAKVHDNIAAISQRLHHTLDSLTSFHFKPQFKELNVKVITNASTIKMEEVLPVFANDAVQLAPEEVYKPTKGAIRGETERTDAERHQERRAKKVRQREIHAKRNKPDERTAKTIADNTF